MKPPKKKLAEFELDPFQAEPNFVGYAEENNWPNWILGVFPAFAISVVIVLNFMQGSLTLDSLRRAVTHDLARVLRIEAEPFGSTEFPLLRDTASMTILLSLTVVIPVLRRQWQLIGRFYTELVGGQIIQFADGGTVLQRKIDRHNEFYRRLGLAGFPIAVLSTTFGLALSTGLQRAQVFHVFAPEESTINWADAAYEGWWASPGNALGFGAYIIITTVVIHYVILQNAVGFSFALLALSLRRKATVEPAESAEFRHGFELLTALMRTVFICMFLTAVALATFMVLLWGASLVLIAIPLAIWMVGASLYTLTPTLVLGPPIKAWRVDELAICKQQELDARQAYKNKEISGDERNQLIGRAKQRGQEIKSVSAYPWRLRVLGTVAYLSPIILGAAQVIATIATA